MTKFERDAFKNFVHFDVGLRIKRFSAGDARQFVEKRLSLHSDHAAGISAVHNADGVNRHVRFLHQSAHFAEIVARSIVLPVADNQHRFFLVRAARDALDAEITGVVKRGVVFRLDEREVFAKPLRRRACGRAEAGRGC